MSILSVLSRSLREMLWPRRFLPFFLLYFLFSTSTFILLLPWLNVITRESAVLGPCLFVSPILLLFLLILVALVDLWFTGALIYDVKTKKGFEKGLKEAKKIYSPLFLTGLVIFLFFCLSLLFGRFAFIIQILIDVGFFFALPAVVVEKEGFEKGLRRSYNLVKKTPLQTLIFWLLSRFLLFIIFIVSLFFIALTVSPIIFNVIPVGELQSLRTMNITISNKLGVRMVSSVLQNYPIVLLAAGVISFFLAVCHCFDYMAKTYYFIELAKRKR